MLRFLATILAVALAIQPAAAGSVSSTEPHNITRYVKQNTILDESVALGCLQYCRGNQRHGWLDYVTLEPGKGRLFRFTAAATLRNRHVTLHGALRAVAYDYRVIVHAAGTLDPRSCMATIERVWLENDRLGLADLARRAVGRSERVANCRDFILAAGLTP